MLPIIKSLAKNSAIYGIGNLSTKLVGFVLLPIYTAHLSVSDYGVLALLEASLQVVVNIFGFGMTNALYRWYWDKEFAGKQKSIFFTILCFLCFTSAAMMGLLTLYADRLSLLLFGSVQNTHLLLLLSFAAALQIVSSIISSLIQLQQRAVLFTTANIVQLLLNLILTIYFIAYANKKISGIYTAQIISGVFYLVILIPFIIKNSTAVFESTILKGMLKFSYPLIISALSGVIIAVVDRYIIKYFGKLEDVGIYSLGYKMANTIYVLVIMSINLAVSPLLYKMMDDPNNKRFYSKILTYYCFGIMICVLGMSFFGKEIIKLMARSPEYWEAHKVIPIISFAILFGVLKDTVAIGLNIAKKTHIISIIIILVSIINIVFNIALIPIFQIYGAAIAMLISQIIFFGLIFLFAQRFYSIPYELGKIGILLTVGVLLFVVASCSNNYSLGVRIIVKTTLLFLFPFILYILQFYEEIELQRLHQLWLKWKQPKQWKNIYR